MKKTWTDPKVEALDVNKSEFELFQSGSDSVITSADITLEDGTVITGVPVGESSN